MKNRNLPRTHVRRGALVACLPLLSLPQLFAGDVVKASNSTALNTTGSWVGSVVPTATDIAVWNNTLTASNTSAIGGNVSFGGIKVTNAGGTLHTIGATAGSTLTLGSSGIDMSSATANLTIGAVMDLSASQTWTVASGRTLSVSGANTGSGTITLAGAGTFAVGATTTTNAFGAGTLNLSDGITLASTSAASRTISNSINLNGNIGILMTGASFSTMTINGDVDIGSATRTISLSNSSGGAANPTLTVAGASLAGTKQITGSGVLALENGNASASPVVGVRLGNSTTDYSVIHADLSVGNNVSVSFGVSNVFGAESDLTVKAGGVLNLSNNAGSSLTQTVKSLSGAGTVTNNTTAGGAATLAINGGSSTATTTFSGAVQNGATGSMSVTKSGTSTQIFSGANNYTGATTISGGALIVNGTHIQSAVGFGYTVNSGGTLGGTGRIARFSTSNTQNAVLVSSGGILAPGSGGIGTLTLDGVSFSGTNTRVLNMASGASFSFDLAGDGSSADQLAFWNYVSGDLLLNSNVVNLSLSGAQAGGTYTVSLFKFYSDSGTTSVSGGILSGLALGTLGTGIDSASFAYNGSSIDLTYTVAAVPEPSAAATLAGVVSLLGALGARRRGKRV